MVQLRFTLAIISLVLSLASAACQSSARSSGRRHHSKLLSQSQTGSASIALASSKASTSSPSSATAASSSSNSSSSSSSSIIGSLGAQLANGFVQNSVAIGILPDDGSGGGSSQSMDQLNSAMGGNFKAQGWYAQISSSETFTGSQLTSRMDQIKGAGGVFQPAVMPTGGWTGLTRSNNYQAVAVCKVMQQFVDEGLEVWLRFAHEVNWYQQDGTYKGSVDDFKEGWAAVAAACKQYAPSVKMWYTPNVADLGTYDKYFPDDISTVDLIGIDFYPQSVDSTTFVKAMKPFHDKYCSESGPKFAIGEMGLGAAFDMQTRLTYLKSATSAATKSAMPHLNAVSWFNYYKGHDFRIAAVNGDSVIKAYLLS